jgi:hypothetical protein
LSQSLELLSFYGNVADVDIGGADGGYLPSLRLQVGEPSREAEEMPILWKVAAIVEAEERKVDEKFLTWLAGFWEGEGCFRLRRNRYPYFDISQSGERGRRILEEIRDRLGLGHVKVERYDNPRHKDRYRWIVTETGDVIKVVEMLLPYMKFRRDEAEKKLALLKNSAVHKCKWWSQEEIAFLVKNYPKMTKEEIAKALNRTVMSVRYKLDELKLRKFKRHSWTEKDVEIIRNLLAQDYSYARIAEVLGVTRPAVMHKWHRVTKNELV